jgi:hypothetical protein
LTFRVKIPILVRFLGWAGVIASLSLFRVPRRASS